MKLDEMVWRLSTYSQLKLSNGDLFQAFKIHNGTAYDLYQVDVSRRFNRRRWHNVDALTAQCILNALLQDPLMQLSDHPER